mgnify:CR=1 FL=1
MDKSKIKGISSIKRKPKTTRATMYMKNGSAMKNEKMMKAGSKIMTSTKTGDCGCGGKAKLQLGGKITPNPYLDAELKRKAAVAGGTIPPNTFTTSRNTRNTYSDLANARQRRASVAPLTTTAPLGAGGRDPLRTMQEDQYTIIDKVTGKLSIFRGSWVADYPDAENYLFIFHSKNFSPNGPNYTHYSTPEFDALYERSITITDNLKRRVLYQKMDSLVMASAAVIPLYYDEVVRFTQKNVSGLGINPVNLLNLEI